MERCRGRAAQIPPPLRHLPLTTSPPPRSSQSGRGEAGRVSSSPRSSPSCATQMASVDVECKLRFLELKAKSHRFIIYKIDEEKKTVVVEKVGEHALNYDDFAAALPENECRYAIFDYDFVTEENCQKSNIFFIAWSPDTARTRSKMIYKGFKDTFKLELDGFQVELLANDSTGIGVDVFQRHAN